MDPLRDMITDHEGRRSKPYADSVKGKITIGVGRNLTDVGLFDDEIDILLGNDIRRSKIDLFRELPWAFDLDEARQMVLIDMTFNMGISGLLEFRNTLQAVRERNFKEASQRMLKSLWAKQVGRRATELSNILETGKIQGGSK